MKYKKEIIVSFCLIIFALGVSLIYVILNPYESDSSQSSSNSSEEEVNFGDKDYAVLKETNDFSEYQLRDINVLDVYIENFNILYKNNKLTINSKPIDKDIVLFNRIAFYNNKFLVLFVRKIDNNQGSYIIFDSSKNTIVESESMRDNMYVIVNSNIYFDEKTVSFNLSTVENDKFIKNGMSICNYNSNPTVNKYVIMTYKFNSKEKSELEEITSIDLSGYAVNNGYC